jgi:SAM-dependent methyltransferase
VGRRGRSGTLHRVDLGTLAWLDSAAGLDALAAASAYDDDAHARAAAGDGDAVDPLRAATALRRALPALDAAGASAALTQVRLRRRARPRLGDLVDHLLLTDDGLEQATRTVVADERARRYAAAGATHVADLGCGLGLDSAAFARAGLRVTAAERDPVVAALAARNLAALGLADRVRVITGDITDDSVLTRALEDADAAYADPARRDPATQRDGRTVRVTDPEAWSPPWSWVRRLADRVPRTAAKVAPGVPHDLTPDGGCATWTSVDGQLVEAEIAWPALAPPGSRRVAVLIRSGNASPTTEASDVDLADEDAPPVGPVGAWLLEPDDAVIRAGLVSHVARRVDGRLLDPRVAYVTTDADLDVAPLASRFSVHSASPYDIAALRTTLVALGVGLVVVKKRAIGADPDDVRRRLRLPRAPGSAVVILTRIGADPWAFVCDVSGTIPEKP